MSMPSTSSILTAVKRTVVDSDETHVRHSRVGFLTFMMSTQASLCSISHMSAKIPSWFPITCARHHHFPSRSHHRGSLQRHRRACFGSSATLTSRLSCASLPSIGLS
jgi:hypothetical protein